MKKIKFSVYLVCIAVLYGLVAFSCSTRDPIQLEQLEGYWQIDNVALPGGERVEYPPSTTIDFFTLNLKDSTGIRTKIQMTAPGRFATNSLKQDISFTTKGGSIFILNSTSYDSIRSEKIVKLTHEELILQNERNYIFTYIPFDKNLYDLENDER